MKKKKELEKGFLKPEHELPVFEEHELSGKEETLEESVESKETMKEYEQLPYEVVHRVIRSTCLVALVAWFVIIVILSVMMNENPFNVLVGLSPVLLTIIVTYILVDKYHMESGFLMVFPFIFTGILFMLGIGNLLEGMDFRTLSSVNIIFGLLFEAAIIVHYSFLRRQRKTKPGEEEQEEEKEEKKIIIKLEDEEGLKKFVSSIEDKSKAINAAIGRVYSVRHGGTEPLRKKIKIDATHYNEFNELQNEPAEERRATAIKLLERIRESLEVLHKPEKEVFDSDDIAGLLNLNRNEQGNDKVLDVLVNNDKDPVKAYYDGALEFCNDAIAELTSDALEQMAK